MALKAFAMGTNVYLDTEDNTKVAVDMVVIVVGSNIGDLGENRFGFLATNLNPASATLNASLQAQVKAQLEGHEITVGMLDTVKIFESSIGL